MSPTILLAYVGIISFRLITNRAIAAVQNHELPLRLELRILTVMRLDSRARPRGVCRVGSVGGASAERLPLRLRPLQPEPHVHLAVHRRRGGEVLTGSVAPPGAPVELPEAEVAVGEERVHPQLAGKCQCLAVVATSVLGAARRRDIT